MRFSGIALVASIVAGALLMAVGVGSPDHGWIGWVALPPLLLAVQILSPIRAALCGAIWGASFFGFATLIGGSGISTAPLSLLLLITIPAAYAAVGSFVSRLAGRGFLAAVTLGLGWIGLEFALTPLNLRHGLLAGTQGGGTLLQLGGGLFGYAFVAFLIASVNGLILFLLSETCLRIRGRATPVFRSKEVGRLLRIMQQRIVPALLGCSEAHPRAPPSPIVH